MRLIIRIFVWLITLPFSAKLNAPLFSFSASGKLANSLVYFGWKGIDAVRSYVIPANPQTDAQTAQRLRLENSVDEWHAAEYTAADVQAWNTFAGVIAAIMSGFNAMVRAHIIEAILGNTWTRIRDVTTPGVGAAGFDVIVKKAAGGDAPTVHYGTRKTHFPDSVVLNDLGDGRWSTELSGLTASTLYYLYIDVGASADDYGRTGIYSQRTTA